MCSSLLTMYWVFFFIHITGQYLLVHTPLPAVIILAAIATILFQHSYISLSQPKDRSHPHTNRRLSERSCTRETGVNGRPPAALACWPYNKSPLCWVYTRAPDFWKLPCDVEQLQCRSAVRYLSQDGQGVKQAPCQEPMRPCHPNVSDSMYTMVNTPRINQNSPAMRTLLYPCVAPFAELQAWLIEIHKAFGLVAKCMPGHRLAYQHPTTGPRQLPCIQQGNSSRLL